MVKTKSLLTDVACDFHHFLCSKNLTGLDLSIIWRYLLRCFVFSLVRESLQKLGWFKFKREASRAEFTREELRDVRTLVFGLLRNAVKFNSADLSSIFVTGLFELKSFDFAQSLCLRNLNVSSCFDSIYFRS